MSQRLYFLIKQGDICEYNPKCLMSSRFMLDDIIISLFTDCTEQIESSAKKDLFPKNQDDTIHLYKGSLQDFT